MLPSGEVPSEDQGSWYSSLSSYFFGEVEDSKLELDYEVDLEPSQRENKLHLLHGKSLDNLGIEVFQSEYGSNSVFFEGVREEDSLEDDGRNNQPEAESHGHITIRTDPVADDSTTVPPSLSTKHPKLALSGPVTVQPSQLPTYTTVPMAYENVNVTQTEQSTHSSVVSSETIPLTIPPTESIPLHYPSTVSDHKPKDDKPIQSTNKGLRTIAKMDITQISSLQMISQAESTPSKFDSHSAGSYRTIRSEVTSQIQTIPPTRSVPVRYEQTVPITDKRSHPVSTLQTFYTTDKTDNKETQLGLVSLSEVQTIPPTASIPVHYIRHFQQDTISDANDQTEPLFTSLETEVSTKFSGRNRRKKFRGQ